MGSSVSRIQAIIYDRDFPQEDVGNLALIKEKFSFYLLLFIV